MDNLPVMTLPDLSAGSHELAHMRLARHMDWCTARKNIMATVAIMIVMTIH